MGLAKTSGTTRGHTLILRGNSWRLVHRLRTLMAKVRGSGEIKSALYLATEDPLASTRRFALVIPLVKMFAPTPKSQESARALHPLSPETGCAPRSKGQQCPPSLQPPRFNDSLLAVRE
jgi:hypothetical protein